MKRIVSAGWLVTALLAGDLERFTDIEPELIAANRPVLALRSVRAQKSDSSDAAALLLRHLQTMRGSKSPSSGASKELLTASMTRKRPCGPLPRGIGILLEKPEFIAPLRRLRYRDLLVATNAIEGFGSVSRPFVRPGVRRDFLDGRSAYALALDTLIEWREPGGNRDRPQVDFAHRPGDQLVVYGDWITETLRIWRDSRSGEG